MNLVRLACNGPGRFPGSCHFQGLPQIGTCGEYRILTAGRHSDMPWDRWIFCLRHTGELDTGAAFLAIGGQSTSRNVNRLDWKKLTPKYVCANENSLA